ANEGGSELRVVGEQGVVGGDAQQGGEAEPLCGSDGQAPVMGEHDLIATEDIGVRRGSSEDLDPPTGDVGPMCLAHPVGKERTENLVLLDAVIEGIHQPTKGDLTSSPLEQGRMIAHRHPYEPRLRRCRPRRLDDTTCSRSFSSKYSVTMCLF